jgi:hypothetical protein
MILKRNSNGMSQLVYDFFSDTQYATSFEFDIPSMGIWVHHEHPWLIIMRETQRTISPNWSDLNEMLRFLIDYAKENNQYPSKEKVLDFAKFAHMIDENSQPGWFTYPEDMN